MTITATPVSYRAIALIPFLDNQFGEDTAECMLGLLEPDYPVTFNDGAALLLKKAVVLEIAKDISDEACLAVEQADAEYFIIGVDNL